MDYPDIEPTLREIGAKPTGTWPGSEQPFYSLPVILDSSHLVDGNTPTVVSDSWAIAEYLDNVYPIPVKVIPDGMKALLWTFQNRIHTDLYLKSLAIILVPQVPSFLNDASHEHVCFSQTTKVIVDRLTFTAGTGIGPDPNFSIRM